jgi:hypothetical protein
MSVMMTVKRALEMIDFLMVYEKKMQDAMADPTKSWNIGTPNIKDLAKTLSDSHGDSVHILDNIKKELIPNCKHPKKMRDKTSDGQWYCMNCNLDL